MAEIKTVGHLHGAYERMTALHGKMRERHGKLMERIGEAGMGTLGGLASGAIRGFGMATIPKTQVPTDLVLGAGFMALGLAAIGEGVANDMAVAMGIGLVSPAMSRAAEKAVLDYRSKHTT